MADIKLASLLLFAIFFSLTRNNAVLCHDHPIIGVLAQEQTDDVVRSLYPQTSSYIYATYVKAIESEGGRVAPIFTGRNESYYRKILSSINGVVLPGGNATLAPGGPYFDAASIIYEIAVEFNKQGKFFPIFGVCLGMEFLVNFASKDLNIHKRCSISHEILPLRFTQPPQETILYPRLDLDQYYTLQYANSTANMHSLCSLPDDFHKNPLLDNDWKITSVTFSPEHAVEFVASIEHRQYPIFAVQFHPEVIAFEWSSVTLYPRSENIISANKYFYNTMVHLARKNSHTVAGVEGEDENDLLIYNYEASYTRYCTGNRRQIYLF